ncbi:hypothetical protein N0V90_006446 [Kalmusia sp. IMI 367209]|nr:hypothetical protein N0V90_006446 [Kalmusia sp. IMI 367209]
MPIHKELKKKGQLQSKIQRALNFQMVKAREWFERLGNRTGRWLEFLQDQNAKEEEVNPDKFKQAFDAIDLVCLGSVFCDPDADPFSHKLIRDARELFGKRAEQVRRKRVDKFEARKRNAERLLSTYGRFNQALDIAMSFLQKSETIIAQEIQSQKALLLRAKDEDLARIEALREDVLRAEKKIHQLHDEIKAPGTFVVEE